MALVLRREGTTVNPLHTHTPLFPSVLHSKGTKPLFKWASSKPWDELQVKAWVFPRGMTPFQRARKGFASVAWSIVILRVSVYKSSPCNYSLVYHTCALPRKNDGLLSTYNHGRSGDAGRCLMVSYCRPRGPLDRRADPSLCLSVSSRKLGIESWNLNMGYRRKSFKYCVVCVLV